MQRRSRATPDELIALGERVRELRQAARISQKELGEPNFSEAFINTLEAGEREPSEGTLQFLARRLHVPVEELWSSKGADWAAQLAKDLRSEGKSAGLTLLLDTMTNLERNRQVTRRALVVLHREVGDLAQEQGHCEVAATHFVAALDLVDGDASLAADQAEALVRLGDIRLAQGEAAEALTHHHAASHLLLELVGRPAP